ncbi:glycosyltransferase [Evansella cellulosilytica]|uniref:Glycosyl transferase family 2 n=1 Tax=Evansella cellulosilytica (strain ATCC 21833 / DSM 2522 / FERM P-1141 / JCM 9156 / N-4) TaxID=649639 RepID=E6TWC6_EVAC2|nr:glycosyltransferase [Evansella cellulosilytica]ADU31082.1 glycosyl transferase family 2 [Evansella cellulosilytica DSM 2522]
MVSIITCTIRQEQMESVFKQFEHQTWLEKELIVILNKDEMNIDLWKKKAALDNRVTIFQLPEYYSLGECLNFGITKASYDYIAKFDDDDYYSPYYLAEAMNAFKQTNAMIVGKASIYVYIYHDKALTTFHDGKENEYVRFVSGGTLTFKKCVANKIKFSSQKAGSDMQFQYDCRKERFKIYSTSKNNYILIRKNEEEHTWKIENAKFLKKKNIQYTDDYESIVTSRYK